MDSNINLEPQLGAGNQLKDMKGVQIVETDIETKESTQKK